MAVVDIKKVVIDSKYLTATVAIADDAPLMTSGDKNGTLALYRIMPAIAQHACVGDNAECFKDVMANTELAHLLEHVTIELMVESGLVNEITVGRTRALSREDRTFEIRLLCPDDALGVLALSSGAWLLEWAYSGACDPGPRVEVLTQALASKIELLRQ